MNISLHAAVLRWVRAALEGVAAVESLAAGEVEEEVGDESDAGHR